MDEPINIIVDIAALEAHKAKVLSIVKEMSDAIERLAALGVNFGGPKGGGSGYCLK